jgi:hypothetical protein
MSDNSIKKIYNEVFKQLYPQIKNCEQGFLYKAIQIIREEEISIEEIIFNSFDIKSSNSIDADNKIISNLVDELFIPFIPNKNENDWINQNVKDATRNFRNWILKNFILDEKNKRIDDKIGEKKYMEIAWIIFASIILVGVVVSRNYYIKKAEKNKTILGATEKPPSNLNPPTPISSRKLKPADLCLVVLAKDVSHLVGGLKSELDRDDVSNLIDRASYFLCIPTAEGISRDIEQNLSRMTDEKIMPDSNREVYVRIEINDGQNLIGEKIPYYLKSNLSSNLKGKIQEAFCIKNLYGLEKLIRI